jgi:serine phosphatase RsbU (regulator of sigma subunit)
MSDEKAEPLEAGWKLWQELSQREAELAIINSVQQGLAARLEVQAIYDLVGDKIRDVFDAQVVMISTYDRQTDTVEHRYAIERGERVYAPGHFPPGGFRTQIVKTRQPLLVNWDVAEQAARLGQPTLPGTIPPKSWLGVPMLVGDQVTGILSLQDIEQENAFDESDVRFLETLAASMSVALENARLFDETERLLKETEQRAAELHTINSVQAGLAQKLDTASVFELLGLKLQEIFQQVDLAIGVYDSETSLFSAPFLVENGKRHTFKPFKVSGEGFIAHLLRNPKSLLINQNMEQADLEYQNIDATGKGLPKSALYVPLNMAGSMHGAIVLEDMQKEHAFSTTDVRLLETLANAMSVALENTRLWEKENLYRKALEREFEIGREIQAGFLPENLPHPRGWEIAASIKSARQVAGDFYDAFQIPTGRIGLVIADVCDKGLGAALFMTLFRSLLRAAANMDLLALSVPLEGDPISARLKNAILLTNNYIYKTHWNTGMFATIFFGILDANNGILKYINAGHIPPIVVNKNGLKQTLERTGPAVGGILDAPYIIQQVELEHDDVLFAYTDGVTDTINPAGDYFGQKGLISLLGGSEKLSALLKKIQNSLKDFAANEKQQDDITLLAVRRKKKRMDSGLGQGREDV